MVSLNSLSPIRWVGFLASKAITFADANSIEFGFSPIEIPEDNVEDDSEYPSADGEGDKQPHELVLNVHGNEGEVEGRGERGLELREGSDDGLHALGGLGEGVFEGSDGGKDLGHTDKNVRASDDPDIEG